MAWKKAVPTAIKDKWKKAGLKDKDIAALEAYSSLEEVKKDPKGALKAANAADRTAILKDMLPFF